MKKYFYLYTLSLLLFSGVLHAQEDFRAKPPKGGPAPAITIGEATNFVLDNGLKVVVVENNRLPRVSFQLSIDAPLIKEGDKVGISSITGQLIRSGTTKKDKATLDEAIDFIGASLNVSSGGMFGSSLTKHSDELLGLMQELLYMPSFPESEFQKIQQQTLSGIAFSKDDPAGISARVSDVVRYGKDHPYGEYQSEETIKNISLEDCKAYYDTYFAPNISYLIIVGDITVAKAKTLANQYFGGWKRKTVSKEEIAAPAAPKEAQVKFVNKAGAVQSVIKVTYPVQLNTIDKDRMASRVMNAILGGGARGRLQRNLREDKGYTYGSYSSLSPDRHVGVFTATAEARNEVTDSSIMEMLYEMKKLRTEKVDAALLQETKNRIAGGFARSLEQPQTVANFAFSTARLGLSKDHYATYLKRLQAVTAEDVLAAAKKFLQPDKVSIVVVGNQEEVLASLSKFGPVEVLDINGNPLEAPKSAGDAKAADVIQAYIKAIGGLDKVNAIKDYTIVMGASVQGQNIEMTQVRKAPGKLSLEVSMMGNVMQATKFDGEKGSVSMMGQVTKVEGEQATAMKAEAFLFPELMYLDGTQNMEISGVEKVGNEDAYVINITDADGNAKTEYYAKESGLKLKNISVIKAQGQTITQTTEFKDYTMVGGVMFPHTIISSGAMPFPIEFKVSSLNVNSGVEDSVFEIK